MPPNGPGASMSAAPRDPERSWYGWKYYHPNEAEDPHAAWHAGWKRGGQAALIESGRLAQLLPMLAELIMRWTDLDVEDDVVASDTRRSEERRVGKECGLL